MDQAGETRQNSTSQPKTILVIAGNYRQFMEWCRENSRSPYDRYVRYINRIDQLHGFHGSSVELVYYGTYLDGPLFTGSLDKKDLAHNMLHMLEVEGEHAERN